MVWYGRKRYYSWQWRQLTQRQQFKQTTITLCGQRTSLPLVHNKVNYWCRVSQDKYTNYIFMSLPIHMVLYCLILWLTSHGVEDNHTLKWLLLAFSEIFWETQKKEDELSIFYLCSKLYISLKVKPKIEFLDELYYTITLPWHPKRWFIYTKEYTVC